MSQFINPTNCLHLEDRYATLPMARSAIYIHRCPPMRTVAYQSPKHLVQLLILSCPPQVACEALEWAEDAARMGVVLVLRDYGITLVPML